ncbi:hypothetical protein R3P38DRAFT_3006587 [Favolaschia claudopus]|uniref:Secreted protein n=1 Tax=Favolaschia claudopus TaxID=2862362 RepID=A0AAW0AJ89_9AGAR
MAGSLSVSSSAISYLLAAVSAPALHACRILDKRECSELCSCSTHLLKPPFSLYPNARLSNLHLLVVTDNDVSLKGSM